MGQGRAQPHLGHAHAAAPWTIDMLSPLGPDMLSPFGFWTCPIPLAHGHTQTLWTSDLARTLDLGPQWVPSGGLSRPALVIWLWAQSIPLDHGRTKTYYM